MNVETVPQVAQNHGAAESDFLYLRNVVYADAAKSHHLFVYDAGMVGILQFVEGVG